MLVSFKKEFNPATYPTVTGDTITHSKHVYQPFLFVTNSEVPISANDTTAASSVFGPFPISPRAHRMPLASFWMLQTQNLSYPAITCVSSGRLTLSDNLHNLSTSQTQVLRNGVTNLNSGQLRFLQPISLQEPLLLFRTQQYVLRH